MKKVRLVSISLFALVLSVSTANAVDVNGKKGIGYAAAIGGPAGLSFNYGVGNLMIEGILGVQYKSFKDDEPEAQTSIDLGIGAHFQVLRAESAAFTAGARVNIGTGKGSVPNDKGELEDITQFGIDIPTRVYWFPTKNISLHTEFGISLLFGPEKGTLFGDVAPEGMNVHLFDGNGAGPFGHMGMTFWW